MPLNINIPATIATASAKGSFSTLFAAIVGPVSITVQTDTAVATANAPLAVVSIFPYTVVCPVVDDNPPHQIIPACVPTHIIEPADIEAPGLFVSYVVLHEVAVADTHLYTIELEVEICST